MCIIGFVVAVVLLFFIFFRRRESYSVEKLATAVANTKMSDENKETFMKEISAIGPNNRDPPKKVMEMFSHLSEKEKKAVVPVAEEVIKGRLAGKEPETSVPITTPMQLKKDEKTSGMTTMMPMKGKVVAFTPLKPVQPDSGYKPYMCKDGPDGLVCKVKQ